MQKKNGEVKISERYLEYLVQGLNLTLISQNVFDLYGINYGLDPTLEFKKLLYLEQ